MTSPPAALPEAETPVFAELRADMTLDGDVALAGRLLAARFATVTPTISPPEHRPTGPLRQGGVVGFVCRGPTRPLSELLGLPFLQALRGWGPSPPGAVCTDDGWCLVPTACVGELCDAGRPLPTLPAAVIHQVAAGRAGAGARRRASSPHVHALHKFKARFFPRLARAFLLEAGAGPGARVLDPFVGSGTTLVEAAELGACAVGRDIDPLAVAITRARVVLRTLDPARLERALAALPAAPRGGGYRLPPWMARKFERAGRLEEQAGLEAVIGGWRQQVAAVEDEAARQVLEVAFSDALARKFNVRMVGTGVGRFALELHRSTLDTLVKARLDAALRAARVAALIGPPPGPPPEARLGDATALDLPDASFDAVVTSPPYLPASSGRENYLLGKSISLTALGLLTPEQITEARSRRTGSMSAARQADDATLPEAVRALVAWLEADPLRSIKAGPVRAYHHDLRAALEECRRVLRPGGTACWVVGKESLFYRFSTREILRRADCADWVVELAVGAGLTLADRVDVELDKANRNARPRSLDRYFETVLVLRRPPA